MTHGSDVLLLCVLATAVATDVRSGKIRNWLTLPAIAVGPVVHLLQGGSPELFQSLAGIGVMVLVAAAILSIKFAGAGDAKLLVAVGSFSGLSLVPYVLLYTALAGGLVAVAALILKRESAYFGQLARGAWLVVGLRASWPAGLISSRSKIPYSIPIAMGTVAAMCWRP